MTAVSGPRRLAGAAFTGAGGLLFAWSLLRTAQAYAWDFGMPGAAWSADGWDAVGSNTAWFSLFALHHSLFARPPVRAWVASIVSPDFERSVYVWVASLLLLAVVHWWIPVPGLAWHVTGPAAMLLSALQVAGIALTLLAAVQLGIRRLSGLGRQDPPRASDIRSTGVYGFVRHPIYFAWLLLVWPTPVMTGSRLLFATVTTVYLAVAVVLEERTLRQVFGPAYDDYRRKVRWRMLPGVY